MNAFPCRWVISHLFSSQYCHEQLFQLLSCLETFRGAGQKCLIKNWPAAAGSEKRPCAHLILLESLTLCVYGCYIPVKLCLLKKRTKFFSIQCYIDTLSGKNDKHKTLIFWKAMLYIIAERYLLQSSIQCYGHLVFYLVTFIFHLCYQKEKNVSFPI